MRDSFYFAVRTITVAPLMAALMLVFLFLSVPEIFSPAGTFTLSLVFLVVLPLLAYPLQKYIPGFKDKGREGQRTLAMIFAVVGYLLGMMTGFCLHAAGALQLIYWEYFLSGVLIAAVNKLFHRKISGHACGIFGPVVLLLFFRQYAVSALFLLLAVPAFIASLKMKRHTLPQLIAGSVVPFIAFLPLYLLMFV